MEARSGEYAERLSVPLRWWAQATMLLLSLWIVVIVSMPELAAWIVTAIGAAIIWLVLFSVGRARITLTDGTLAAGRAHIDARFLGPATALDADATRLVAGRDADARAFLLLRPWLKRSVQIRLTDPSDPAPYWLLNTRDPQALAAAVNAVVDGTRVP